MRGILFVAIGVIALWGASQVQAQVYRCQGVTGTYMSDRPCPNSATSAPNIGVVGPVARPAYGRPNYLPSAGKAEDHINYLSPRCSELSEGIRTGRARGVDSRTMSDLQNNYRRECGDEDSAARQRWHEDQRAAKDQKKSVAVAQQAEVRQAKLTQEQCHEMLRILAGKRRQADTMTDGQKADLQRFQANYSDRCKR